MSESRVDLAQLLREAQTEAKVEEGETPDVLIILRYTVATGP